MNEGTRIESYEKEIKGAYPSATRVLEQRFLPLNSGGTSFMGLVARLLGEGANPDHEGIKTRRYLYHVYEGKKPVGIAHGSSFVWSGKRVDVVVLYNSDGTIKELKVTGLPDLVAKELESGNYLEQFEGRPTEDFETVRGKRGRIKSRGDFLMSHKKPPGAMSRGYFEKIVRAVRYNAAFMDVAYFITKHPDLDNESEKIVAVAGEDGPEAFVKNRKTGETLRIPSSEEAPKSAKKN